MRQLRQSEKQNREGTITMNKQTILALDLGTTTGWALRDSADHISQAVVILCNWRDIPGWPDYEVSNKGHVRRKTPGRLTYPGKVLKPLLNKSTGYLSVCLSRQGRLKRIDIHRLVALTFLGHQPSPRHLVAHNDGVRTNNCVANLRWATQQENLADMRRHGTSLTGSANPMCKLDEIDREAIRRMKRLGIPRSVIAEGYGVHERTVFRVLASDAQRDLQ